MHCGLGPSLLVAPVFVPLGEETEYYLPAGRWTHFFDSTRTIEGPKWVREHVALDDMPVWVRQNTVLILGPDGIGRPDYDYTKDLEVRFYDISKETVTTVPTGKGTAVAGAIRAWKEEKVQFSADESLTVASWWIM